MTLSRILKWIAAVLLALVALAVLFIATAGWNWLRAPIERMTLERTGRVLVIGGDFSVQFGWPRPRLHADAVTFANPAWAREKQMFSTNAVEIAIDLPQLLMRNIVLPEIRVNRGAPELALRDVSTPYALKLDESVGKTGVQADGTVFNLLKLSALDIRLALRGPSLEQICPLIGARPGRLRAAQAAAPAPAQSTAPTPARARVLPDLAFKTERWDSVDAEVTLKAKTIRHAKALPLDDLTTHLSLRDSVLTLDPLDFGIAGDNLKGAISLDGRKDPIKASARVQARKIQLGELFPTSTLGKTSIGQVNGEFNLTGSGNSVGRMLASADCKVALVVAGGEISKLMMKKMGLQLWEILELKLSGDGLVKLRCAAADLGVNQGVMQTNALIFDTEVTTLLGSGQINLAQEKLDLTLNPKTKNTSPLSLRSPIYIRGSFAQPEVGVDKGRVALRALGAVALGAVNPLLALIPLIDAGPGQDSDCGQLVRDARALPRSKK